MARKPAFYRAAGVVSAAVFSSRITGLLREIVMARLFGAGQAYDAFLLAVRIPNLTRNLFAEGALSSAFVPAFTRTLAAKGRKDAAKLSNSLAAALMLVTGAVCALGIFFSPELVRLLAPGFAATPAKFELAVLLTRIMFPFLILVSLAAQAMGVLNACDRYGIPALASTLFNIGSVAAGLALGFTAGRAFGNGLIISMAFGVVAGGALQLACQIPSLRREGFAWRPETDFSHRELRRIFSMMVPAVIGNAALQINVTVNTRLASSLTDAAGHVIDGPVSWLGYAFRFMQFPLGLFGVAVATATLPAISRSASAERTEEFRETLAEAVGTVLLLAIPSSVGLAVLGESIVGALFEWGRFTAFDTRQTAAALTGYSVGLAGYSVSKVLSPALYALDDARTPMLVSIVSVAVNYFTASMLAKTLGHVGLALSTSLVAVAGALALYLFLGAPQFPRLARGALKITMASALMGGACLLSTHAVHAFSSGKAAQFADIAVSVPFGAAIFYGAARALRIHELEALKKGMLHCD